MKAWRLLSVTRGLCGGLRRHMMHAEELAALLTLKGILLANRCLGIVTRQKNGT